MEGRAFPQRATLTETQMTTESKHTPGPWYWDDKAALPWMNYDETIHAPFLMDAKGGIVMSGDDIRIKNEADGQLMIAAPDLLEALDALTLIIGLTPILGNKEALQEAMDQARAAIAKAERRSI